MVARGRSEFVRSGAEGYKPRGRGLGQRNTKKERIVGAETYGVRAYPAKINTFTHNAGG